MDFPFAHDVYTLGPCSILGRAMTPAPLVFTAKPVPNLHWSINELVDTWGTVQYSQRHGECLRSTVEDFRRRNLLKLR